MTLNVEIDEGACLAHGDCVHAAPGVFEVNGDIAEIVGPGHRRAAQGGRPRLPRRRDPVVRLSYRRGG